MKNIVGGLAIVLLCCAMLAIEIAAAQWELHWVGYVLITPFGVCMYYVTRWMRGPGSEFGTHPYRR